MADAILSVKNLSVDFHTARGTVHAVKNVSWSVSRSETLAILGESGSGKSVSANAVMNLLDTPPAKIVSGEIEFGPAIRETDGGWSQYGAVPAKGAVVRMSRYRFGGGRAGNVAAGTLNVMRSPIPGVDTVTNPLAATGGVGRQILRQAIVAGHDVTAVVRNPQRLISQVRTVTADLATADPGELADAIIGADAVLS